MMVTTTVDNVNRAFAEKGMEIALPLAGEVEVTKIEVLEKVKTPGRIKLLLQVGFLDGGREMRDVFLCEGPLRSLQKPAAPVIEPPKKTLLPLRERMDFASCEEALLYLREAFSHLLKDKGYLPVERGGADLYFERE